MNVSKVLKKGLSQTQTGTPYYASPEVWRDMPYDMKSDIWSLGCVLYESIMLKPPFRADDMQGLYKRVIKGVYPKIPPPYSKDLTDVVKLLLQVSPHLRPSLKRKERYFPNNGIVEDEFTMIDRNNVLMQTIKIPKNLYYLSDRLPKPSYHSAKRNLTESDQEDLNERQYNFHRNVSDPRLPSIKGNKKLALGALKEVQRKAKDLQKRIEKKNSKTIEEKRKYLAVGESPSYEAASSIGNNSPMSNKGSQGMLRRVESQFSLASSQAQSAVSRSVEQRRTNQLGQKEEKKEGKVKGGTPKNPKHYRSLSPQHAGSNSPYRSGSSMSSKNETYLKSPSSQVNMAVNKPSTFKNTASMPDIVASPAPPKPKMEESVLEKENIKHLYAGGRGPLNLNKYKQNSKSPSSHISRSPQPVNSLINPSLLSKLESSVEQGHNLTSLKARKISNQAPLSKSPLSLPYSIASKSPTHESASSGRVLPGGPKLKPSKKMIQIYGGTPINMQIPGKIPLKKKFERFSRGNSPIEMNNNFTPGPSTRRINQLEAKKLIIDSSQHGQISETRVPKLPSLGQQKLMSQRSQGSETKGTRNGSIARFHPYGPDSSSDNVFKRPIPKIHKLTLESPKEIGPLKSRALYRELAPSPPQNKPPPKLRPVRQLEPLQNKGEGSGSRFVQARQSVFSEDRGSELMQPCKIFKTKRGSLPIPKERELEGDNSMVASANQVLQMLS